jgi:CRP-like cAMP-binding protein
MPNNVYCSQGKVKAVKVDNDDKDTILAIHSEAESFGEISLIDGQTSPAAVITIEQSKLAIINSGVAPLNRTAF